MLFLIMGCSSAPPVPTWGEALEDAAYAVCEAQARCGAIVESDICLCAEHIEHHFCGLYGTCDVEITESDQEDIDACAVALQAEDICTGLYFGIVPEECRTTFDSPDPRETL